ncbi:MAG TPA: TM0106 family RecB-like putative nuclease [Ornithinimicrobium sp.]|uniref:TM0106 family RecB-like putative nuclease n=1 Tax=Ornithinimicrobium sp. TaxID=1977084 RepID=UPI002B45D7E9|nr:TM0106 family RecB-like putative nuclease [Ornithinimicrobium sp.]HKJ10985.1 TM0106 family RecB-like putative nuclease [Ornithinimicrobium sp.]
MQIREGRLVLSATDLTKHVACPHVTTLDLAAQERRLQAPEGGVDAQLQLIFDKGLEHERAYRELLLSQGRRVVDIPDASHGSPEEREGLTVEAMRSGADVVFQAALFDGSWMGFADFLLRVERPGALGDWSYDIADTKLARRLKVPALLQMATYAVRLTELQGVPPAQLTVVAGDGVTHPWRLVDVSAYASRVRRRLESAVADPVDTEPVPTAYCSQCRWQPRCSAQWEDEDDLCLVAGLRSGQRERLLAAGVDTLTALAEVEPGAPALQSSLSAATRGRVHRQAQLQLHERHTGTPAYELLDAGPGAGLQLLPPPDEGDVYLDFEGDPFAPGGQGLEYLAGLCDRDERFHTWWAHDAAGERRMVADLLTWLVRRWERFPGMHVYHYAAYEQAVLKRLTAREAVAETELDLLLRGERFVDLYAVVRQGLQISKRSYSLKKLESFYWSRERPASQDGVDDAMSSVVEYERWASSQPGDPQILDRIAAYNYDDVRSTLGLHGWLEDRRDELAASVPEPLTRPSGKEPEQARDSERIAAENALAERLLEAGEPLLAGCVGWHRREDKQMWWEYFRTAWMSPEELVEDRAALGGVTGPERTGEVARSLVWRYRFPPQEARVGRQLDDVVTRARVGEVVAADLDEGWVEVKRGKTKSPLTATGLVTNDYVRNGVLRDALGRLGEQVLADERTAAVSLLRRRVPGDLQPAPGESPVDVVRRVGLELSGQVLAVQGPPGSGKTYAGQLLIQDLLDAGLRVGVTAPSHSVVAELMRKTGRPGVRKAPTEEVQVAAERDQHVRLVDDNGEVEEALATGEAQLAGGTAWLWSHERLISSVDVLVIDEAGQFSLANALAVAGAARSLVLLGDPQQLAAPSNGVHPYGAGVSVLEHMLQGAEVMPPGRGVFLDRTWRMHPDITAFVSTMSYADQLQAGPGLERQQVLGVEPASLCGSGLRWRPVAQEGYSSENALEAEVVAGLAAALLQGRWADSTGRERPIGVEDILVVAPYNAHVAAVAAAVPDGIRVGTVDKFQGRQAPVVIYTLASSSAADAPRGVDFLYDIHRLNVAVSRARAMSVVVGSPTLLEAEVRSPEQLRAVNALCRFADEAELVELTDVGAPGGSHW